MIEYKHVEGKEKGKIIIYALSTCGWCKKTKRILDSLGIAYDYVDADLVDAKTSEEIDKEVRKWNPKETYPTIVINNEKAIVSYDEDKIRELAK
jgi:glutaredoxin